MLQGSLLFFVRCWGFPDMLKGLFSIPSAAIILLLRKKLGIEVVLYVAAVCGLVVHVTAHLLVRRYKIDRKVLKWCPLAMVVFYAGYVLFGGRFLSREAIAWTVYLSMTFVLPEQEQEQEQFTVGVFGFPCSWFLVSGMVASWAGAIVIPLDWDVEWQVFPISSSILCAFTSLFFGFVEQSIALLLSKKNVISSTC
jgi:hypothetical protein